MGNIKKAVICVLCVMMVITGCGKKGEETKAPKKEAPKVTLAPEETKTPKQSDAPESTATVTATPKSTKASAPAVTSTVKPKKRKVTPKKTKTPEKEEPVMEIKKITVPASIENDGKKDIAKLYMSQAGMNQWSDDLLQGKTLKVGEKVKKIKFKTEPDQLRWDLKLVYAGGKKAICHELDVSECDLSKISITLLLDEEGNAIATVE